MFYPRQPMNQMGPMRSMRPMGPMRPMRPPSMSPQQFGFRPPGMYGGMQGMQGQGRSGLGGLLKKLIPGMGHRNPMQGMQGMGGMPGFLNASQGMNPGTLQNLANPSNLSAMMGNVQKTLKMAESVVPMVQQYGPIMKNIPAMIRMYNAIKNAGDEEEENNETISLDDITSDGEELETEDETTETTEAKGSGKSVPKLYI